MFNGKRIKALEEKVVRFEKFEKSVCTIIDNYFATNEKHDLSFSTGDTADKFYHFVKSVDEKFKRLGKIEEKNAGLKAQIAKEREEHKAFCEMAKKKVDEQDAIINAQTKEIKELFAKTQKATEKRGQK